MSIDKHGPYCRAWQAHGDTAVFCCEPRDHRGRHEFERGGFSVLEAQADDEAALSEFAVTGIAQPNPDDEPSFDYRPAGEPDVAALIAQSDALEARIRREDGLPPGPLLTSQERALRAQETTAAASALQALMSARGMFLSDPVAGPRITRAIKALVLSLAEDDT